MEQLHLVGCTPDLRGLIFSTRRGSNSADFWVALDEALVAQVEQAAGQRRRSQAADSSKPRSPSLLTPREMQARLRVGRTVAEVAEEAGVDEEWVDRFAPPIWAEQAQVVARALAALADGATSGRSKLALGPSVARNLADQGILLPGDVLASAWSASQAGEGIWAVRFQYAGGDREISAHWEYDGASGEVTARDRTAADLGYVDQTGRRMLVSQRDDTPAPTVEAAPKARSRPKPAAKSVAAGRRRVPRPAVTAPLPTAGAPADPPAPSRPRAARPRPRPLPGL